jgi:release factor glutamine methyltransferase
VLAGTRRFGPLTITYDAGVLEPRPWTLLQSEWAVELGARAAAGPLLELCAGAGQIGLVAALGTGRPLVQVERDEVAAGCARANAAAAGIEQRVEVRAAAMEEAMGAHERFPIILADPPYLRREDIGRFPDDPVTAIDGGPDGLAVTRLCLALGARHLTPGGALLLQVAGRRQAEALDAEELGDLGLALAEVREHDPDRAVALLHSAGHAPRRSVPTGGSRR